MDDTEAFEAAVRDRAYALWQQAGSPADSDLYFWLAGEAEIRAERRAAGGPAPDAPSLP